MGAAMHDTNRRGFLRGLTTLPLVGGSVALIGNPVGAAEPPSEACLDSYLAWLHYEQRAVRHARWPEFKRAGGVFIPANNAGDNFHRFDPEGWKLSCQEAVARAPVVLAAVGCDWRAGR